MFIVCTGNRSGENDCDGLYGGNCAIKPLTAMMSLEDDPQKSAEFKTFKSFFFFFFFFLTGFGKIFY